MAITVKVIHDAHSLVTTGLFKGSDSVVKIVAVVVTAAIIAAGVNLNVNQAAIVMVMLSCWNSLINHFQVSS